jgi:hypothetical protein
MREKNGSSTRRFWVVSPNVADDYHYAKEWKKAIIRHCAAFMGYPPNDKGFKKIGSKFAHEIKSGDVVLIARRHDRQPEIVGFGVVLGKFKRHIKNFVPPGGKKFSMRELSPFLVREQLPPSLNVMSILGQTAALRHIRRSTHEKICSWLERQLSIPRNDSLRNKTTQRPSNLTTQTILAKMPADSQLEYKFKTRKSITRAKRLEAELLKDYCDWLAGQGKALQIEKSGRLRCDGYESDRGNLIEAKSKVEREYIRMAVGQLFDYAFLGRKERARPNLAILLPAKPAQREIEWLKPLKISVIWRQKDKFKDNARNRFC